MLRRGKMINNKIKSIIEMRFSFAKLYLFEMIVNLQNFYNNNKLDTFHKQFWKCETDFFLVFEEYTPQKNSSMQPD